MIGKIKKRIYFLVAGYFWLWASAVLDRWQPEIIVVTGSNGKTTLLNLLESQLKEDARYTHKANSAFGIAFNVLGLKRTSLQPSEWFMLFLKAPIAAFTHTPKQKIYVVEADADRPREASFIAKKLKPDITLWVSSDRTHSMNYDNLVARGTAVSVDEAIAQEFSQFARNTTELVLLKDQASMLNQVQDIKAAVKPVSMESLKSYKLLKHSTEYITKKGNRYTVAAILPEAAFMQVAMSHMLMKYLKHNFDPTFSGYQQPPGRSSVFTGIKNITLFDSSYNSNLTSVTEVIKTFTLYPGKVKWLIIGDMIEQGNSEAEEHKKLAKVISKLEFDRIIFVGPRVGRYTKPALLKLKADVVQAAFDQPKQALDYIKQEIEGDEVLFFKGARWLEGIISNLLENSSDRDRLCRREDKYQEYRVAHKVG